MDYNNYITNSEKSNKGKHLTAEERGEIQALKRNGFSNREIARQLKRSPSTIGYELKRGTLPYTGKGRKSKYSAKRGLMVYRENRKHCRHLKTVPRNSTFIKWTIEQIREHKWSFDVCVGFAKKNELFEKIEIPCTKTLYNMLWNGELSIKLFEFPEVLSRKKRGKPRLHKMLRGTSIVDRPCEVDDRTTFGHWESDTVIGKKKKGEPAVFTIVERLTGCYISLKIDEKTTNAVYFAMKKLKNMFGDKFSQVFKSITTDNGSEFADFSKFEEFGTKIYFANPYSSWERPINERTNRILRKFIKKGSSIFGFTSDEILQFSDEINSTPRKSLNYSTPEELFDAHLDKIYISK